jgi:hypothetical protein
MKTMATSDDSSGSSFFARYIDSPKKERPEEPSIVQKGPHPIIPPTDNKSPPIEKLLDWIINRWPGASVNTRNIMQFGPGCLRDRKSAIAQAETLARYGWLTPLKTHQHRGRAWQIIRGPGK